MTATTLPRPTPAAPRHSGGRGTTSRWRLRSLATCTVCLAGFLSCLVSAATVRAATLVVAGYGPEQPVIRRLAAVFEKAHPGNAVDIRWNRYVKAVELVKAGEAQVAVTGHEEPGLAATPIAWDGIAIIVNFANPVKEVTTRQVAGLLDGSIGQWVEVGGAEGETVEVLHRPPVTNLRAGLERSLGITLPDSPDARRYRVDQTLLSAVGGRLNAVSYVSLQVALEAFTYGLPVRMLLVDRVEPGEPPLRDGRYTLKRPVLLLTAKEPAPLTRAFVEFARSAQGQRILDVLYTP